MHHLSPVSSNPAHSAHVTSPCSAAATSHVPAANRANAARLVCFDSHHHSRRALRVADVQTLTGDSRSQVYARMSPKCTAYDKGFPRPFYVGKSPRWWEHEVIAWLEALAAATQR